MPTLIGTVFFLIGIYCFFYRQQALLGLLIVSSIFQASAAISFGTRGIQSYYLVETIIIARSVANYFENRRIRRPLPYGKWLMAFGLIAISSAFILPFLFAGRPVYDPLLGIDLGLLVHPPLRFGLTNVSIAFFLTWHIATAYSLQGIRYSGRLTNAGLLWAFYLLLTCVFAQAACELTGIPYPDSLIRTNPDIWDLAERSPGAFRKPGTFLEPSFAGAFLVFFTIAFAAQYLNGRGSAKRVALALIGSGMVTSSGSLFTLAAVLGALMVSKLPFRGGLSIDLSRLKRLAWIFFVVAAPILVALLFAASYRDTLLDVTVSKGDSGSFFNRTASDVFAVQLAFETYGLGVGLGSTRSSSFVTYLASNVGVLGLVVFFIFYFKLFMGLSEEGKWLKWAGFALLLNMCVDVPDLIFPVFQFVILLAIAERNILPDSSHQSQLNRGAIKYPSLRPDHSALALSE